MAISAIILIYTQSRYVYRQWNSEAHLYGVPKNTVYDIIILGASHGRVLSSTGNHLRLEEILSKKILNLSKTSAGVIPAKIYLEYFYSQGNSTKIVYYIIDPFIFYSSKWNEDNYFLEDEPFKFDFLAVALRQKLSKEVIINYIRSKFSYFWFVGQKPVMIKSQDDFLMAINNEAVQKRLQVLYPQGISNNNFERYIEILEEIIVLANKNNNHVVFIFPSTLLGDLPGKEKVLHALEAIKQKNNIEIYDFSDAVKDSWYFSDHDHFNTIGVEMFTSRYLKLISDPN